MRSLKYVGILSVLALASVVAASAQVAVGVQVGSGYGGYYSGDDYDDYGYESYGPAPVCPYGYYSYAPYACAPYGYYGPDYFVGGVFIGVGPWYHNYYGGRGYYGRGYYGRGYYGRGGYDRGYRGGYG